MLLLRKVYLWCQKEKKEIFYSYFRYESSHVFICSSLKWKIKILSICDLFLKSGCYMAQDLPCFRTRVHLFFDRTCYNQCPLSPGQITALTCLETSFNMRACMRGWGEGDYPCLQERLNRRLQNPTKERREQRSYIRRGGPFIRYAFITFTQTLSIFFLSYPLDLSIQGGWLVVSDLWWTSLTFCPLFSLLLVLGMQSLYQQIGFPRIWDSYIWFIPKNCKNFLFFS